MEHSFVTSLEIEWLEVFIHFICLQNIVGGD